MEKGWISLNRQIQEHWLWKDKPFDKARAWIDLLLLANFEDKKTPYKGEIVVCERGAVNMSILSLSKRWGWGRDKTRDFLRLLERDEMIVLNATTNRTTITIVNYDKFQILPTTNTTTNPQRTRQRTHNEPDTTNKDNKDNNINNKLFKPPTVDEVKAYCRERNNSIDAEAFVSFYESKGWMIGKNKMKDWKAAVRTWEQKDKQSSKPTMPNYKKGTFFQLQEQNYDMDELERILQG